MRKFTIIVISVVLVSSFLFSVYCGHAYGESGDVKITKQVESNPAGDNGPSKKLGRGFSNCTTFILEVPSQMKKINEHSGPLAASSWGLVNGLTMAGVRLFAGIYEIVTFPLPLPSGYKPVLNDPEFFYQDMAE